MGKKTSSRKTLIFAGREVKQDKNWIMFQLASLASYLRNIPTRCGAVASQEFQALKNNGLRASALEKFVDIRPVASKPNVQVTTLSAAGGAVTLGAGGGLAGLVAGTGIGAGLGIV